MGLQLDYIRYPFQDPAPTAPNGYGEVARSAGSAVDTGVDPMGSEALARPRFIASTTKPNSGCSGGTMD